jgi:hypothetical protein
MRQQSHSTIAAAALIPLILSALAAGCGTKKKVYFKTPGDGEEITGQLIDGKVRVKVVMEVEGLTVRPAGEVVEGTGHHHIIIDKESIAKGEVVPTDGQHIHFGKGQTVTEIAVEPGDHTLTLQFADGAHQSYGAELSATVKVKIVGLKEDGALKPSSAVTPTDAATPTNAGEATPTGS